MFSFRKTRQAARHAIRKVRDLAEASYKDYAGSVSMTRDEDWEPRQEAPVREPRVVDPANIPLPPGTRPVPRVQIPEPKPVRRIRPGVVAYHKIAGAADEQTAIAEAAIVLNTGNLDAVLAGLEEYVRTHPEEPQPAPVPLDNTLTLTQLDIGSSLLSDWGALDRPYLADLFAEKEYALPC